MIIKKVQVFIISAYPIDRITYTLVFTMTTPLVIRDENNILTQSHITELDRLLDKTFDSYERCIPEESVYIILSLTGDKCYVFPGVFKRNENYFSLILTKTSILVSKHGDELTTVSRQIK